MTGRSFCWCVMVKFLLHCTVQYLGSSRGSAIDCWLSLPVLARLIAILLQVILQIVDSVRNIVAEEGLGRRHCIVAKEISGSAN